MENPLVSIVCTTYNHQDYIKDALEGFLIQKTTFPFEIIVHDDASTDSTVQIVKEYEKQYPDFFYNVYQQKNQYSKGVDIWGNLFCNYCRGQYIAICEGDDYWTDPLKLQKQVDYLEENKDVSAIFTRANYIDKNNIVIGASKKLNNDYNFYNFNDMLVKTTPLITATVLFRSAHIQNIINGVNEIPFEPSMRDLPLFLELVQYGTICLTNKFTTSYRVLLNSASCRDSVDKRMEFIDNTHKVKEFYHEKYSNQISKREIDICHYKARYYQSRNYNKSMLFFENAKKIIIHNKWELLKINFWIAIMIHLVKKLTETQIKL